MYVSSHTTLRKLPPTALRNLQSQALSPSASESTGTGRSEDAVTLSPEALRLTSGGNSAAESRRTLRNARAVYRRHGNQGHDLTNRTQVGRLISRTPQLDNSRSTHNDDIRCGGAALMNAMLLDGDHAANARAIRTLAEPVSNGRLSARTADGHQPFEMTESQREALSAMERGNLTPNQTSELQEMLFQMTDGVNDGSAPREAGNTGVTPDQMHTMLQRLSRAGAFPNTQEVNLRMDRNGEGGYHWTTTSTNSHGTQHANSWPSNDRAGHDGYATVEGVPAGRRGDYVYQQGSEVGTFGADVTMRRGAFNAPRISGRAGTEGRTDPASVEGF